MQFPEENALRRERHRLLETIESLTDDEFDRGSTLCEGWAPRDVLAHVVGADSLATYARPSTLTIDRGNAAAVEAGRAVDRAELTDSARQAAANPSLGARALAWLLAGDVALHHQDVLRGLGRPHGLPDESARLVFREGLVQSWQHGAPLMRHKMEPTTPGCRPRGRGRPVIGTAEALGLWLAGRSASVGELEFG